MVVEPTPFTHISGYANRFQETLKYLSQGNDTIEVVTPDHHKDAPSVFQGFRVHTIKGFRFSVYKHIYLSFDLVERRIKQVIRKLKPDIIHATSPGFLVIVAMLYSRLADIPLVVSYHTHLPKYAASYMGYVPGIEPLAQWVVGRFHNLADLSVVTSPQMKAELSSFGVQNVAVWQKGIDTQRFHPRHYSPSMRHALSAGHPKDPLLLYVGRLGSEKKLSQLKHTLEKIPRARLAFVGEGPGEEELRRYFNGMTRVEFIGPLRGEALSQAFASADVFCMPSDSETLGFVVLESMASGVPVVGADAGGIPHLVSNGSTGYLVKRGDEEEFTSRVKELLEDRRLRKRMGAAARKEAEKWGWENATWQLRDELYPQAIELHRLRKSRRWSVRLYRFLKHLFLSISARKESAEPAEE